MEPGRQDTRDRGWKRSGIVLALARGQAHELPMAPDLHGRLPDVPGWIVGARGFTFDAFRERIRDRARAPRSREMLLVRCSSSPILLLLREESSLITVHRVELAPT